MGKRIPKSRRHKKLKFVDPCYRGPPPRTKKKQLLFNEPPADENAQELPHGMEEFIDLKSKVKLGGGKIKKKKKKKYQDDFLVVKNNIVDTNASGMEKPVKKMPKVLKQKKSESEGQFINRLQNMADKALAEAKVEEKYKIELVNVDKDGNAQYRPEGKEMSEAKKEKRRKLKEREQEKKKQKMDDEEFELKKEEIKFGDVVFAPPQLTAKPRKAPEVNKPGKKKLVLKQMIPQADEQNESKKTGSVFTKWKEISPDRRKMLENERSRVVQMYRLLKNKKTLA